MLYLKPFLQEFPFTLRFGDLTLHLDDASVGDIIQAISGLIAERGHSYTSRRIARVLHVQQCALFVKSSLIENLRSRLRMTLGKARRKGGLDWPIAELINTSEAYRRGLAMPRLKGFGYRRVGHGLVTEIFLVSECLDGCLNGVEWLKRPEAEVETFLLDAFDLMRQQHEQQVFHLDLWVENLMLSPQNPRSLKVIDLENCHIGKATHFAETLGFQFGFLYQRCVLNYIDEARYDQLVNDALLAYPGLDRQRFDTFFHACKHVIVGRKERREILLRGVLIEG
ncbi:MAG TPA: lipopolysaccharide kinase InaA family protein [Pseudomonas sp.]|nr:lipopolysaccharide kinase InaA family protein [Pseudomonas sp.]